MPAGSFGAAMAAAWQRTRQLLFAPFEITTWLVAGFSAWLTMLGRGSPFFHMSVPTELDGWHESSTQAIGWLRMFLLEPLFLTLLLTGLVVLLVWWLLCAWLRARGTFLLLDNVASGAPAIVVPWRRYGRLGWSLFWWRLAYGACLLLAGGLWMAGAAVLVATCLAQQGIWNAAGYGLMGLLGAGLLFWPLAGLIGAFLTDFVTPLMMLHMCGTNQAWRLFLGLFAANIWCFLGYAVLRFLLVVGVSIAFLLLLLVTCGFCCLGALLLALPYAGTVVALPYYVYMRHLSLSFLAGFGPAFDAYAVAGDR